jgi:para-aminobenzoate synthetase / 4-amino-4-deoxychorismate lyase
MDNQDFFIKADEVLLNVDEEWLHFASPQCVIQADALNEVIPALREIEDLVQINGWHAAGFVSYEAAPAFDPAHQTQLGTEFPYLWFGLYPAPRLVSLPQPDSPKPVLSWQPTVPQNTYNAAHKHIKNYIADGRTYQVNYTMRLQAEFNVDPWNFFIQLVQRQNNYAAFLDLGRYIICSASPELFFHLDGDILTCRPMKGTSRRGRTTREDQEQVQWLKNSEKNRAENVMIVDMIRNDLGRIAKVGSVSVPELFAVEKHSTLWQMTSTVQAKTDASLTQIFSALFPCASITGAPKVSTMRIISELEVSPRRIYTGSIGYIAPNRKATFNVAIRTALIDQQEQIAEYGVGGGIVWDSTDTDEYDEALLKARLLTVTVPPSGFSLLETMLWIPEEGYFLREKHIARLLDSADYFDFRVSIANVETILTQLASTFTSPQRIRLLLDRHGNIQTEQAPFIPVNKMLRVGLAGVPINSNDVFLFHKTTHRAVYSQALLSARSSGDLALEEQGQYDDVLLYNERGELTEFTIGNLVMEMNGQLYTPPTSCGLLAGTFREHLLETGKVKERVIPVEDLKNCTKMFLVNSVRQWIQVHFE